MGNHMFHNENSEEGIFEFVNRESLGPVEDLNADTILTFSLLDDPILLVFVDLKVKDQKEGEIQKKFIDEVLRELHFKQHAKVASTIVVIDDTENGNKHIRDIFTATDKEKFPYLPQLILLRSKINRFLPLDPAMTVLERVDGVEKNVTKQIRPFKS